MDTEMLMNLWGLWLIVGFLVAFCLPFIIGYVLREKSFRANACQSYKDLLIYFRRKRIGISQTVENIISKYRFPKQSEETPKFTIVDSAKLKLSESPAYEDVLIAAKKQNLRPCSPIEVLMFVVTQGSKEKTDLVFATEKIIEISDEIQIDPISGRPYYHLDAGFDALFSWRVTGSYLSLSVVYLNAGQFTEPVNEKTKFVFVFEQRKSS